MTDEEALARIREKYRGLQGDMPPFGDVITLLRVIEARDRAIKGISAAAREAIVVLDDVEADQEDREDVAIRIRNVLPPAA